MDCGEERSFVEKIVEYFSKEKPKFSGIYYCQEKTGDKTFENFCKNFLPNDFEVKEHRCEDTIPVRLFLVFFLPSVNRQNNVDVLYDFVTHMITQFQIKETNDIRLIQISFDGNRRFSPPNLVNGATFERLKSELKWEIASCIDIIYTDEFNFVRCDINKRAARAIRLLSHII